MELLHQTFFPIWKRKKVMLKFMYSSAVSDGNCCSCTITKALCDLHVSVGYGGENIDVGLTHRVDHHGLRPVHKVTYQLKHL